jgi:hypothetical protein
MVHAMNPSAIPPGYRREQELRARLDQVLAESEELRATLPFINDPVQRKHAQDLADAAALVAKSYQDSSSPGPALADDLAGLMSAARAMNLPAQDPELGLTATLEKLRKAKGLIIAAVADASEAAAALGLYPKVVSSRAEAPIEVTRVNHTAALRGIAERLDELAKRLDALDRAAGEPTPFRQQMGLVNFYVAAMRVEIDLAELHLTINEATVDFGALVRTVEVISDLTRDFFATVRAWGQRVSDTVIHIAQAVREKVRRLVAGTRTTAQWIARRQLQVAFDPQDPECIAEVAVYAYSPAYSQPQRRSTATSIRLRVRSGSRFVAENVMAYITEIEKLSGARDWKKSTSPDVPLMWVGHEQGRAIEISSSTVKYLNILHIDHNENVLSVYQAQLPTSTQHFLEGAGTYRFTVSILGTGIKRENRILIKWQRRWDTLQVLPAR